MKTGTGTEKIRIIIVDDHGVMRAGLRLLLEMQPDMEVVGEAGDGEMAVQLADEVDPDVVILDLELPVMGGLQAAEKIREVRPMSRILVLTMHEDPSLVRAVMAEGCAGYVVKDALGEELISAIRTVHQGRNYINAPLFSNEVVNNPAERPITAGVSIEELSGRERQVLELLAKGYTNQQIGERLHISPRTVGTYRFRLSEKLGLSTRADIVRYALESGLLRPNIRS